MRTKYKNLLLLDCGDSFDKYRDLAELRAEISMKGLSIMGYDALNIADGELSFGLETFDKVKKEAEFPLLSANIYKKGKRLGCPTGYTDV